MFMLRESHRRRRRLLRFYAAALISTSLSKLAAEVEKVNDLWFYVGSGGGGGEAA